MADEDGLFHLEQFLRRRASCLGGRCPSGAPICLGTSSKRNRNWHPARRATRWQIVPRETICTACLLHIKDGGRCEEGSLLCPLSIACGTCDHQRRSYFWREPSSLSGVWHWNGDFDGAGIDWAERNQIVPRGTI